MNIVITRLFTKGEYTHGHLTIDGIHICDTLYERIRKSISRGNQVSLIIKNLRI